MNSLAVHIFVHFKPFYPNYNLLVSHEHSLAFLANQSLKSDDFCEPGTKPNCWRAENHAGI